MQSGTAIAVITATLMAIGVALGVATSGGDPNRIEHFEQIVFIRNVEHGEFARLGTCPLGREIIIEPTGRTQIIWYAQNPAHHGCARALGDKAPHDIDSAEWLEWWEEPIVARVEFTFPPEDMYRLVGRLESLSWVIEWTTIDRAGGTHSLGCESIIHSFPDRQLLVFQSENRVASLASDERYVKNSTFCIENERMNAATLDTAFAAFAPLLPDTYELRPEVASRLDRGQ